MLREGRDELRVGIRLTLGGDDNKEAGDDDVVVMMLMMMVLRKWWRSFSRAADYINCTGSA